MKKRKLKLHKRKIPLEMALILRSKHSVKESKKIYNRNKKFPFDDNKNNYHQTDFLFDNFIELGFKVIKRFCSNYTIYNFPIFE